MGSSASGPAMRRSPGTCGHVALPAARDDGVAAPHQEAVAHVDGRVRVGVGAEHRASGAVEVGDGHGVAAVDDVQDEPAARAGTADGKEDRDVRGELHTTGVVAGRPLDVGDARIRPVERIDREVEPAPELLVGSGVAEEHAIGEQPAQRDLEARDGHWARPLPRAAPTARPHPTSGRPDETSKWTCPGQGPLPIVLLMRGSNPFCPVASGADRSGMCGWKLFA